VDRTADTVAAELVAATRALVLGGRRAPAGAPARALLDRATKVLSLELGDRPFADDIAAARRLLVAAG
jgi:histidine ammonia-lyase